MPGSDGPDASPPSYADSDALAVPSRSLPLSLSDDVPFDPAFLGRRCPIGERMRCALSAPRLFGGPAGYTHCTSPAPLRALGLNLTLSAARWQL